MFERLPSNWMLALKSIGYWFWVIPVALLPLSYKLSLNSANPDA